MSTIFWLKTLTARFENRPDYLKRVLSQEIYFLYIRFQRILDFKAYRKDSLDGQIINLWLGFIVEAL